MKIDIFSILRLADSLKGKVKFLDGLLYLPFTISVTLWLYAEIILFFCSFKRTFIFYIFCVNNIYIVFDEMFKIK